MEVVNVKKKFLIQKGYKDFEDWVNNSNNVYIGRNMSFYIKGALGSKWQNPFSVKKYGRDECLKKYKEYIVANQNLLNDLEELRGKTLGCFCWPEKCHGNILIELLAEKEEK